MYFPIKGHIFGCAYIGIEADFASIDVYNGRFENNYIGIDRFDFSGFSQTVGTPLLQVRNSGFHGTDNLLPSFFNVGPHSSTAIRCRDVQNINLGTLTSPANIIIEKHFIGIYLDNCFSSIINGVDMSNMRRNLLSSSCGIRVSASKGSSRIKNCKTLGESNGLLAEFVNSISVESSVFSSTKENGLVLSDVNFSNVYKVQSQALKNAYIFQGVQNIDIKNSVGNAEKVGCSVYQCKGYFNIQQDTFTSSKDGDGLSISASKNGFVKNNSISGGTYPGNGIIMLDVKLSTFSENNVYGSNSGIDSEISPYNTFCCNRLEGNDFGMTFREACIENNIYGTTLINNAYIGLRYQENSDISTQFNRGNTWEQEGANTHVVFIDDDILTTTIDDERFRVEPALFPKGYNPYSGIFFVNGGYVPQDLFLLDLTDPSCDIILASDQYPCLEGFQEYEKGTENPWAGFSSPTEYDVRAIQAPLANTQEDFVYKWNTQRMLMQKLMNNDSLKNHSAMMGFFEARENTALGQLAAIEYAVSNYLNNDDLTLLQELEQDLLAQQSTISDQLDYLVSGLSLQDSLVALSELQYMIGQYAELASEQQAESERIDQTNQWELQGIYQSNESIIASEIWQSNEKYYNAVYLKILLSGEEQLSDTDKQTIESIAIQCPSRGGLSVYKARDLANRWSELEFPTCESEERKVLEETENIGTEIAILNNPVASGEQLFISVPYAFDEFTIQIISPDGRLVKRINYPSYSSGLLSIPTVGISSGLYYLHCTMEDDTTTFPFLIR